MLVECKRASWRYEHFSRHPLREDYRGLRFFPTLQPCCECKTIVVHWLEAPVMHLVEGSDESSMHFKEVKS